MYTTALLSTLMGVFVPGGNFCRHTSFEESLYKNKTNHPISSNIHNVSTLAIGTLRSFVGKRKKIRKFK